jgi:hypothetical protein
MQRFDEVVRNAVPEELFIPEIEIDAEIELQDIQDGFCGYFKPIRTTWAGKHETNFFGQKC